MGTRQFVSGGDEEPSWNPLNWLRGCRGAISHRKEPPRSKRGAEIEGRGEVDGTNKTKASGAAMKNAIPSTEEIFTETLMEKTSMHDLK